MEEQEPKRDNTFYIHWLSFALGLVLGFLAVIFIFLSQSQNRRDKIYSSLLGMGIGMLINFFVIRYFHLLPVD